MTGANEARGIRFENMVSYCQNRGKASSRESLPKEFAQTFSLKCHHLLIH